MTTVSPSQILSKVISVITGLTPAVVPLNNLGFAENPARNGPLRTWPIKIDGVGAVRVFRVFEAHPIGDLTRPGVNDPEATFAELAMRVTVAYSSVPTLYGFDNYADLHDVISADAIQIANALARPTGLVGAGHLSLRRPTPKTPDRGNAAIWFQDIDMVAQFYLAR